MGKWITGSEIFFDGDDVDGGGRLAASLALWLAFKVVVVAIVTCQFKQIIDSIISSWCKRYFLIIYADQMIKSISDQCPWYLTQSTNQIEINHLSLLSATVMESVWYWLRNVSFNLCRGRHGTTDPPGRNTNAEWNRFHFHPYGVVGKRRSMHYLICIICTSSLLVIIPRRRLQASPQTTLEDSWNCRVLIIPRIFQKSIRDVLIIDG